MDIHIDPDFRITYRIDGIERWAVLSAPTKEAAVAQAKARGMDVVEVIELPR